MEIEKANDDIGEIGEELGNSLAVIQEEDDDEMIAMEETVTQDTEMETEINVAGSWKVSGGRLKIGKKSKTIKF